MGERPTLLLSHKEFGTKPSMQTFFWSILSGPRTITGAMVTVPPHGVAFLVPVGFQLTHLKDSVQCALEKTSEFIYSKHAPTIPIMGFPLSSLPLRQGPSALVPDQVYPF